MQSKFLKLLLCPTCQSDELKEVPFTKLDGIIFCKKCRTWYPIDNNLLEFLPESLCYKNDRRIFFNRFKKNFSTNKITFGKKDVKTLRQQKDQQKHSDWYAENDLQTYTEFEHDNFWEAFDFGVFSKWSKKIKSKSLLLDLGCAQGRSTFKVADKDIDIVAFDISKKLVRQAKNRYDQNKPKAKIFFFIADATRLPLKSSKFDYVLVYGVLHHLDDPKKTAHEIGRVLKNGGLYLGNENNTSNLRKIFDQLQKIKPIWHEEAGVESLISEKRFKEFFGSSKISLDIRSTVYLPPHFIRLFPIAFGSELIKVTDQFANSLPFIKGNGGLLIVEGRKSNN